MDLSRKSVKWKAKDDYKKSLFSRIRSISETYICHSWIHFPALTFPPHRLPCSYLNREKTPLDRSTINGSLSPSGIQGISTPNDTHASLMLKGKASLGTMIMKLRQGRWVKSSIKLDTCKIYVSDLPFIADSQAGQLSHTYTSSGSAHRANLIWATRRSEMNKARVALSLINT